MHALKGEFSFVCEKPHLPDYVKEFLETFFRDISLDVERYIKVL